MYWILCRCVVVLHNLKKNKQLHLQSCHKKTITSLAYSSDGRFLATGECGHQPMLRVWDLQDNVQVAEFPGHKYGISCVAFSPNLKYVVSVGSQHDMIVNVWDWKNSVKVASNKISSKVKAVAFNSTGSHFVTVGNRHVKFWYLEYNRVSKFKLEPVPLMGRSAILGDQRNNYFRDVACGRGPCDELTYSITKSGLLCQFNSRRLLEKWVELQQAIDPTECQVPPCLCHLLQSSPFQGVVMQVICVYNDHSMYVWDVRDLNRIGKSLSFLYHSACIWGVEVSPTNFHRFTTVP
ncbi:WDR62 [Cordylochernes scorpioides]|uniref:WDR62 n=1 Tax=Cordylochernes scorpioides TaxID=51811 RepID=A0ABY6LP10_9ARAC|nr:WDR62 [Cordylochernes scorpioides]